jgi:hypothetical protein
MDEKVVVILSVLAKDLGLGGTASRSFMSTFRMTTHIVQHFQSRYEGSLDDAEI